MRNFEKSFLIRALTQFKGDTVAAAEHIGLPACTLRDRVKACALEPAAFHRQT